MSQQPRILIFTGDGKGKTTAALGMAFRASGHGLRSSVIQFIKSDESVGEIAAAAAAAMIDIEPTGLGRKPRPVWTIDTPGRLAAARYSPVVSSALMN